MVVGGCVMEIDGWRLEWVGKGKPEPVQPMVWGRLLASALLAVDAMANTQAQQASAAQEGSEQGEQLSLLAEPPEAEPEAEHGGPVIVQPRHGRWPHPRGRWRDDEREAAFEMRHRWRVRDRDLARIVGAARQAINIAIGDRMAPYKDSWPAQLKWRPSAELLEKCGIAKDANKSGKRLQKQPE